MEDFRNLYNIMAKGLALYTRDSSCHKSCCHHANTNAFLGSCDGWMKTTTKRQNVGSPNPRHTLVDVVEGVGVDVVEGVGVGAKKLIICSQNV